MRLTIHTSLRSKTYSYKWVSNLAKTPRSRHLPLHNGIIYRIGMIEQQQNTHKISNQWFTRFIRHVVSLLIISCLWRTTMSFLHFYRTLQLDIHQKKKTSSNCSVFLCVVNVWFSWFCYCMVLNRIFQFQSHLKNVRVASARVNAIRSIFIRPATCSQYLRSL